MVFYSKIIRTTFNLKRNRQMEDILGNLTEEQKSILKQFRRNLEDILTPDHTDYALVKYLRASNFNLKDSEKIFRVNFNNRNTFGVNTILEFYEKPEVIKQCESTGILGFAKDGTLIHYIAGGRIDFYGLIMSMSCYDLCMYFSYLMEFDIHLLKEENKKTGKNIQEITFVIDLEGFTLQQVLHKCVIEMSLDFATLFQECYPELWSHVLIVNVPGAYEKAFNLFKPVLRTHALNRMRVADKNSSKDLLLKYIDEDILPAFLGGKKVDSSGDPLCREFITFAGKVPEKLYSQNQRILLTPTDPDVKCVVVRQRSVFNVVCQVRKTGTKWRIQVRSENGSIPVRLFFKKFAHESDNENIPAEDEYIDETTEKFNFKQISVEIKEQAHCTQEDMTISVSPGIYIAQMNNARNWFTSRKLLIKSEITVPKQESIA